MNRIAVVTGLLLLTAACARAQSPLGREKVLEAMDRDGEVRLEQANVVLRRYDFVFDGDSVEAIAFHPADEGRHPGVLLIPGFSRTARDYLPTGLRFAREGFAALAVTQRGFGRSTGEPDFVGPRTLAALEAAFRRFRRESYVDSARMGVFGYSRGGMAASLLAVRLAPAELRAAVFAAGVYDFQKAYDEIRIAGIRTNMEREAGLSREAVEARSSILRMDSLACPVLILHGEKDENVPVGQAHLLRDRLTDLRKPFELKTFPDAAHAMDVSHLALEFLGRHLKAPGTGPPEKAP